MRKMKIAALLILLVGACAGQNTETKDKTDPIEPLAGKWDIDCKERGCLMFTDVLIGDPDHPADLSHPEFITIAVAVRRSDRKVDYFAFHVPPDVTRDQGVFIGFISTARKDGHFDSCGRYGWVVTPAVRIL